MRILSNLILNSPSISAGDDDGAFQTNGMMSELSEPEKELLKEELKKVCAGGFPRESGTGLSIFGTR